MTSEMADSIHSYERGSGWIDRIQQQLGEPDRVISPETHHGTQCRTVIYYYPDGVTNNPDFFNNNTTLIIKHTEIGHDRDFRLYGRIVRNGKPTSLDCQHITEIRFPEDGVVQFIDGGDQHFPPQYTGIEVTKDGSINYIEREY